MTYPVWGEAFYLIGNLTLILIGIMGIYLCIRTLRLLYNPSNNGKNSKPQISDDNNPSEDIQNAIEARGKGLPNSHFNISKDEKDEKDDNCDS